MSQEIYVRPFTKATIIGKERVLLKDIADVSAPTNILNDIENLCVLKPSAIKKTNYLVTIIDIIKLITAHFKNVTISNLGEADVIVEYFPEELKKSALLEWLKVMMVCIIVFSGSTVAIMAYQTDTSLSKTFTLLNKIFTGETTSNPLFITIPYSLGIPVGTLVFFNHIGRKKLTDDPTPIQVEVNKYEEEVETTIAEAITEEMRRQKK